MNKKVLVVDLDHTLIHTDLLFESSVGVLKKNPFLILFFPYWFMRGKGYLKDQLVRRFDIDVRALPYNKLVIDFINEHRDQYAQVVLATASHKAYAFAVVKYLQSVGNRETVASNAQNFDLFDEQKTAVNTRAGNQSLFDDVMASNAEFNLSSHNKAKKLIERFGEKGFDYMGDHMRDMPVWEASDIAILVNASKRVIDKTRHLNVTLVSKK